MNPFADMTAFGIHAGAVCTHVGVAESCGVSSRHDSAPSCMVGVMCSFDDRAAIVRFHRQK